MHLIFLYGVPGVGKRTAGQALARRTGYKLFHAHLLGDMLHAVFEWGTPQLIELHDHIWPLVVRRAIDAGVPGLITTWAFERSALQPFLIETFDAVRASGGQVLFVELRCDRGELARRLASPSRRRFHKIRSIDVVDDLIRRGCFRFPALPSPPLVVDTTAMTPRQAANVILARLSEGQR